MSFSRRAVRGARRRAVRGAEHLAVAATTPFRGLRWEVRPPTRWPIAARASLAVAIPLTITTLTGHHTWGLLCGTGVFTVLYGAGRPLRSRARVLLLVAVGLIGCMALGTLASGNALLSVLVTALVGAVATFLAHALRLGPPGAFFFVLLVGIGGYLPSRGLDPWSMVGATALGASIAVPIALFDLLLDRRGPERAAVAAAGRAVQAFINTSPGDADAEDKSTAATNAIHDAWTTLWDGGDPVREDHLDGRGDLGALADDEAVDDLEELVTELLVVQQRYSERLLPQVQGNPDLARESMTASLGRPSLRHLIRRATRWPTTALQAALRVATGIAAAGIVSGVLLDTSHMYWAMAAAALVLHTGLDRRSTAVRSVERLAGTALGILLFLLGGFSGSGPWTVVATVVLLQGLVELLVVRNYTLAVVFMTPLALTIGTAGSGLPALEIAQERLVDTAIGVLCGVAVPWFVGWRAGRKMLAKHLSRVLSSSADAIALLAVGRHGDRPGLVAQRELSLDLQELSAVAGRAIRDEPHRVEDLVPVREATAWLGFTVIATAAQTPADEPLERVVAAVEPARELAARLALQDIPDHQEIRTVRALVGRRPQLG
ncbi:FUSC family protein [Ornithinimicrobium cryptoxanthini]|uniref:FUSC family protein n=1 Tax=Ornithinimicrobium cryptoxanthini TaxID=2934161 RepID=A0ABY4YJU1_9MICO|nr:FUSC family protein [Ornithinimicrobium cryptoxanthini]USQ76892.1 FUSC family protein [Ornithinimicrobium cryptoxanthini]